MMSIKVIGLLSLDKHIPVDLALAIIEPVQVRGVFHASQELNDTLVDRLR